MKSGRTTRRGFLKCCGLLGAAALVPFPAFSLSAGGGASESAGFVTGRQVPELMGSHYKLIKEAAEAFEAMRTAAESAGIDLFAASSYRSFADQLIIWNKKYRSRLAEGHSPEQALNDNLMYSAIPGTSRHHWGTEIDVIDKNIEGVRDPLREENYWRDGVYGHLKEWLNHRAADFGFIESYTNDYNRPGFSYEPWHFSYKPVAVEYLKQFVALDYKMVISADMAGADLVERDFYMDYLQKYILGINAELLPA